MSRDDSMSLRESPPSGDQHAQDVGEVEAAPIETSSRQAESKRRRACVLLGSSLIQLPIWGFAMSYGVFQEYFFQNWTLDGAKNITGIIGTTSNGVMYLSMPFLFALFTKRYARYRRHAAIAGALLASLSFGLSSLSTHVWHLVATQGVLAALGCALIFSPTTLSLGEWYNTHNRALAYAVTLSCKNIVGSTCPFIFRGLLDTHGFRPAIRIWTGITLSTALLAITLIPTHPSNLTLSPQRQRKLPWSFLKHRTIYIYSTAITLQSAGYGIPQTYLSEYAREVTQLSQTSATLLLTLFNVPGIAASSFFGFLCDNKYIHPTPSTVTAISAIPTALAAFLFWGLTSPGSQELIYLFSVLFGFFSSGYSSIWGGMLNEMEREAGAANEAIDTGMVYGLLNGARGVGYVSGGLASVPIVKAGANALGGRFGYGSTYGPLIIFTGLSSAFGGWGLLWKGTRLKNLLKRGQGQVSTLTRLRRLSSA